MTQKPTITFVNHASVLIESGDFGLLSDPWYEGDALHKGWDLIVETTEESVVPLLARTTHIYLSHEHPDHFSIKFFKQYLSLLKERKIEIIFQMTADKRVKKFIEAQGLSVRELPFEKPVMLRPRITVTCIKDGLIDSGLLLEVNGLKILNLNDCNVNTKGRVADVHRVTGDVDWLLTQFSYAAWKGGKDNLAWRQLAAKEKLDTMQAQIDAFKPKVILPFASFVYFSNERNFYLNDSVNLLETVVRHFKDQTILMMKPLDCFDGEFKGARQQEAVAYWKGKFDSLGKRTLRKYRPVSLDLLQEAFKGYVARIAKSNNWMFMTLLRYLSPVAAMRPVVIELDDIQQRLKMDLIGKKLEPTNAPADLSMGSESFQFFLKNTFDFDTITSNGCFEEVREGSFLMATKTMGIENLNNVGIYISPSILFNPRVHAIYFGLMRKVARRMALRA